MESKGVKNYSIWKEGIQFKNYERLNCDIECDVLIIGGGMTGVNTLYQLRNSNLKVVLVEQNRIGMGVTAGSTGKLTYLQDSIYNKIIKNYDEGKARQYLKSQRDAVRIATDIIKKEQLDCDLVSSASYVYTNHEKEEEDVRKLRNFLIDNGIDVFEKKDSQLVDSRYMIGVEDTYLFHPVKFLYSLIECVNNMEVYEDTSIVKMEKRDDGYSCYTQICCIRAKTVVIASHYAYFNLPYMFPMKGSLEKSYLSASLFNCDNISLISYSNPFVSIRNYKDYLIYLSNSRNNSVDIDDKKNFEELLKKIGDLGLEAEYLWSNIDILTNDSLPYVGKIDDRLLIGTGYNTWGMSNGILAGKILADIIMGKENEYVELFQPKRNNLKMVAKSIMDGCYSAVGFIKGRVENSEVVEYQDIDGKEVGIYRDEDGEHKVYTKCPHMGCRLMFNEIEKTWDCPCHASRFDKDGKCISGPSNRDISFE